MASRLTPPASISILPASVALFRPPDPHAQSNSNPYSYSDAHADADAHSNPDSDSHADANADSHPDPHSDADPDASAAVQFCRPATIVPEYDVSRICVVNCEKLTYDLYIVNPDGTERHMGTKWVKEKQVAPGLTDYYYEDQGLDWTGTTSS